MSDGDYSTMRATTGDTSALCLFWYLNLDYRSPVIKTKNNIDTRKFRFVEWSHQNLTILAVISLQEQTKMPVCGRWTAMLPRSSLQNWNIYSRNSSNRMELECLSVDPCLQGNYWNLIGIFALRLLQSVWRRAECRKSGSELQDCQDLQTLQEHQFSSRLVGSRASAPTLANCQLARWTWLTISRGCLVYEQCECRENSMLLEGG